MRSGPPSVDVNQEPIARGANVPFEALMTARVRIVRSLLFAASFFPLSCLILDHLLCPDHVQLVLEKLRHNESRDCESAATPTSLLLIIRFHNLQRGGEYLSPDRRHLRSQLEAEPR